MSYVNSAATLTDNITKNKRTGCFISDNFNKSVDNNFLSRKHRRHVVWCFTRHLILWTLVYLELLKIGPCCIFIKISVMDVLQKLVD